MKLGTITKDIVESKVKIRSIDSEIMRLNRQKEELKEHVREQTIKETAQRSKYLLHDAMVKEQQVKLQQTRMKVTEIELAMVKLGAAPGYRCQKIQSPR